MEVPAEVKPFKGPCDPAVEFGARVAVRLNQSLTIALSERGFMGTAAAQTGIGSDPEHTGRLHPGT